MDAFMAALDDAAAVPASGSGVAPSAGPSERSSALPRWLASIAVATVVIIGGLFIVSTNAEDDPYQVSVAVMPFENRTGDPAFENLGRSVSEELVHLLTTVPELRVIDPYTAASLMRDSLGTPALLDTLAVDHLIHGYIEARDGELVVNVSESDLGGFLSARTQHRIDPDEIDIGQVQLANLVARSFLADLGLEDRFDPGGTVIGPGRDAYLAGNEALGQRTPAAMREAIARFRQATTLEPESAAALSALSSAFALTLYYKYDVGLTAYELAARALAAADSAIAVDPNVANGYSARGYARALLGMEIEGAAADFARAEQLAPNAPNGPSWSARILARQGRIDEAFAEAGRARDLDPLQAGRRTALASLGFQLGRYDVTIEESREAYRLEPRLLLAKAFEARALALMGRGGACAQLELGVYQLVHSLCLVDAGRTAEAAERVEEAVSRLETGDFEPGEYLPEVVAQDLASYYGFTGDAPEAARWLRFAFDRSPAGVDERILGSALFAPVADDPDFAAAVAEVQSAAIERVLRTRAGLSPPL
jgi:TolB-like protein